MSEETTINFEAHKKEIAALKERISRLQKALDAATDIGIYPLSAKGCGAGDYEKRTEFMEGWNGHAIAAMHAVTTTLERGDWPLDWPDEIENN